MRLPIPCDCRGRGLLHQLKSTDPSSRDRQLEQRRNSRSCKPCSKKVEARCRDLSLKASPDSFPRQLSPESPPESMALHLDSRLADGAWCRHYRPLSWPARAARHLPPASTWDEGSRPPAPIYGMAFSRGQWRGGQFDSPSSSSNQSIGSLGDPPLGPRRPRRATAGDSWQAWILICGPDRVSLDLRR